MGSGGVVGTVGAWSSINCTGASDFSSSAQATWADEKTPIGHAANTVAHTTIRTAVIL
jgi:hypothetical protein